MQCAAVIARSPCRLRTTAAVQKCTSLPFFTRSSAPIAAVPLKATAVGGDTEALGDGDGDGDAPGEPDWSADGTCDGTDPDGTGPDGTGPDGTDGDEGADAE